MAFKLNNTLLQHYFAALDSLQRAIFAPFVSAAPVADHMTSPNADQIAQARQQLFVAMSALRRHVSDPVRLAACEQLYELLFSLSSFFLFEHPKSRQADTSLTDLCGPELASLSRALGELLRAPGADTRRAFRQAVGDLENLYETVLSVVIREPERFLLFLEHLEAFSRQQEAVCTCWAA